MRDRGTQLNAIFLATIVVVSVVAMGGLFVGPSGGNNTSIAQDTSRIQLDTDHEFEDATHKYIFNLTSSQTNLKGEIEFIDIFYNEAVIDAANISAADVTVLLNGKEKTDHVVRADQSSVSIGFDIPINITDTTTTDPNSVWKDAGIEVLINDAGNGVLTNPSQGLYEAEGVLTDINGATDSVVSPFEIVGLDSITASINGDTAPSVVIGDSYDITVDATATDGTNWDGETISVDNIDDGVDGVTVNNLDTTSTATTSSGTATFSGVSFDGNSGDTVDITFSAEDGSVTDTMTVTLESGGPDSVTYSASPTDETATADGSDAVTYTVTVTDKFDNPISGETVEADGSAGSSIDINNSGSITTGTTDSNGEVAFSVTSTDSQTNSDIVFTEGTNGNSATGSVTFEAGGPDSVSYTAVPTDETAIADGSDDIVYTARVTDAYGNPISGETVEADGSAGSNIVINNSGSTTTGTTDSNGEVAFSVTSTDIQTNSAIDFTEQTNGNSASGSATFEAGNPDSISYSAVPSDETAVADGADDIVYTVSVTDSSGNPVSGETVEADGSAGSSIDINNSGSITTGTTDSNGEVAFSVTSTDSQTNSDIVFTEETNSNSVSGSATFEAGSPASVSYTATPSDETAIADGSDDIVYTVTVTDGNNNPVSGVTVDADGSAGSSIDINNSGDTDSATTDSNGEVVFGVTSTDSQTNSAIDFTEQTGGNSVSGSATFEAGDPDSISYTADPGDETAIANGSDGIFYTITVEDANNNPVPGETVAVDGTAGTNIQINGSGSTFSDATDSNGEVVFNVTSIEAQSDVDVSFTEGTNSNSVSGSATFEPAPASNIAIINAPATVTAGESFQITIEATDDNGNLAENQALSNFVLDSEFDGQVVSEDPLDLDGNAQSTVDVNTDAVVTADSAHTLTADADNVTDTGTVDIVVEPAGANTVEILNQPAPQQTTGAQIEDASGDNLTTEVTDPYGNLVQGVTVHVNHNKTRPPDIHGDDWTDGVVSNSAGQSTFSDLVINSTSSYELTFDISGDNVSSDDSNTTDGFEVTSTGPDSISIVTQPGDTTAGVNITGPPQVNVTDEFGNRLSDVDVSVSVNGGSLDGGTPTRQTNATGTATFDDIVIETAGENYELEFTVDGTGITNTSDQFAVTAADPADVIPSIGGDPSPDVPVDIGQDIDVRVEDEYGNPVPTETVEVTRIHTTGQTEVDNLNETDSSDTQTDGNTTFTDVVFTGEAPQDATLTFAAENGVESELAVNVLVGEVDDLTARIDGETSPTVPVGALKDVNVTVRDTSGNLVDGEDITVSSIDESQVDAVNNISAGDTVTSDNGSAIFPDVEIIGKVGQQVSMTFRNESGDVTDEMTITLETGKANTVEVTYQPQTTTAGETIESSSLGGPTAYVTDAGDNFVEGAEVTVTEGSGYSFDSGTITRKTNDNGLATFDDLVIQEMGDYELEFSIDDANANTSASDTNVSQQFSIVPANADSVTVETEPSDTTAGDTIEGVPTANVTDEFGNPVPGVTVDVAEIGGYAFDSANTTTSATSAIDGLATFGDLVIETTGTYSLEFSIDGNDANVSVADDAQTGSFDVLADTPTQLHYVQPPTNNTAGELMQPNVTVEVLDQYGNLNPTASHTIILELTAGPGQLDGTVSKQATDGTAEFRNLTIEETGTYRMEANNTPIVGASQHEQLTPVESDDFVITPNDPTNVSILTQPGSAIAGETIPGPPTVDVRDEYGNLVPNVTVRAGLSHDVFDEGTIRQETGPNGTATFDDLEIRDSGTYRMLFNLTDYPANASSDAFNISHADLDSVTPTILGQSEATVTAGVPTVITVAVQDEFGNPIAGEEVSLDSIDSGEDDVNVTGLGVGNTSTTAANGEVTFSDVIIEGDLASSVEFTFSASDGTNGVLNVTLEEPIDGFVVDITNTNSPVHVSEEMFITIGLLNNGIGSDTQTVELRIGDFQTTAEISLGTAQTAQHTFTWQPGADDLGFSTARVSTEDDSDNVTVNVFAERPEFEDAYVSDESPETVHAVFDKEVFLNEESPETAGFSVSIDGSPVDLASASTEGQEVRVELAQPVEYAQSVRISYDDASANVVDEYGVRAEPFQERDVDNQVREPFEANLTAIDPTTGERSANISVDVSVEEGVTFSAANSILPAGTAVTYEWKIGNESFTTDEPELSQEFLEPGDYEATVTVQSADRSDTASFMLSVVDLTAPDAQLSALETVDTGQNPQLDASASEDNVGIAEYQWEFGDGTTIEGEDLSRPNKVFQDAGEYEVQVTVVDSSGNTDTATTTVVVESTESGVIEDAAAPVTGLLLALLLIFGVYYYYRRFR